MARSNFQTRGGGMFDIAVATLAAGSAAFVAFAMPEGLFSSLIVRSGIPAFIAAAEPPLGAKARLAVVAAAALVVFVLVLAVLRALDRLPARPKAKPQTELPSDAPRVRRADAHPDAPPRRPLIAGRDLGEPIAAEGDEDRKDSVPDADTYFADLEVQPLPGFLAEPQPQPEPEPQQEPVSEEEAPLELTVEAAPFEELTARLPEAAPEPGARTITDLMQRLESGLSRRAVATESEPEPEPEPRAPVPQPAPSWLTVAEAEPVAAEPEPESSVTAEPVQPETQPSLAQVETPSLVRKPQAIVREAAPESAETARDEGAERVGHRLRSAINDLQQLAARGG